MSIESLGTELGVLRARIDAQRANTHSWPTKEEEYAADIDRYDRRLLKAAAMLGLDARAPRGRDGYLLKDDEREGLEGRLAHVGLDVRSPPVHLA